MGSDCVSCEDSNWTARLRSTTDAGHLAFNGPWTKTRNLSILA